ncbi:hypothetical protein ColLi_01696 [Colletotrichum liriopes]|uniref:Uncharacterized protein n=1 Tax=Colletotrichum liriopes TaxID=708192 RepID=A0AA37GDD8_9PEZI|nr:hypothetical protein ColLi_01696 [Colletotrichum liriopes]
MEESRSSNAAMSATQLPSINDQLVTPADGRLDPAAEGSRAACFSTHGDAAEAVYSECVVRSEPEVTEEAFRLPLPFNLYGARFSSGDEMKGVAADELLQHGFKPFGGNPNRPQRLERLLDHWASLVERGVWSVGPHGVQGSNEVFKDATMNWADYAIPSSW